jgi:S1-C subfamily serine protease
MTGPIILDVVLCLVLFGYLLHGFHSGLALSLSGLVGLAAGAMASFLTAPLIGQAAGMEPWRIPAILAATVVLLGLGHAAGSAVGRIIRRTVSRTPLRVVDRMMGAVVDVVIAALVFSVLSFGIGSLGVPALSNAIGSSQVLRTIDAITPNGLQSGLAQLKNLVARNAAGRALQYLAPPAPAAQNPDPATVPKIETRSAALQRAAASVMKVTGLAPACRQTQSGSGFVVAPARVLTNAHVVAGVTHPVVQDRDGRSWASRVVYFDARHDVALLAVPGLRAPPLHLSKTLTPGTAAVFDGYPLGGPYRSDPAAVRRVGPVTVHDIYDQATLTMPIYWLSARVEHGNSGGPLLALNGTVAGVVFATDADGSSVGYALTPPVIDPVIAHASAKTATVISGRCIAG